MTGRSTITPSSVSRAGPNSRFVGKVTAVEYLRLSRQTGTDHPDSTRKVGVPYHLLRRLVHDAYPYAELRRQNHLLREFLRDLTLDYPELVPRPYEEVACSECGRLGAVPMAYGAQCHECFKARLSPVQPELKDEL